MSRVPSHSVEGWNNLRRLAEAVFDLNLRLPDRVSSLSVSESPFFDGDVIFDASGWHLASSLALAHGDPTVHFLVVEPDESLFTTATGEYGGFSCPSGGVIDNYLAGLFGSPPGSVHGQIGYAAETVAVIGASGRWGIWVERNIAGLVVSSDPSALGKWSLDNGPFLSTEDALDGFLGMNLGEIASDSDFTLKLRRNYGSFTTD